MKGRILSTFPAAALLVAPGVYNRGGWGRGAVLKHEGVTQCIGKVGIHRGCQRADQDALTREILQFELLPIWETHPTSMILITHSIE